MPIGNYIRSSTLVAALAGTCLSACSAEQPTQSGPSRSLVNVAASDETTPSRTESAGIALLWGTGANARIFGAVEDGVEVYSRDGSFKGAFGGGKVEGLALVGDMLLTLDTSSLELQAWKLDASAPDAAPSALMDKPVKAGRLLEGMCAYKSDLDGATYAFLLGSDGIIEQWQLEKADGKVAGRQIRTLQLGTEPKFCVADAWTNSLYVTEEAVGIWRFDANPEAEVVPKLVDVRDFGNIEGEVAGLALVRDADGKAVLLAGDAGAAHVNVYDLNAGNAYLGSAVIAEQGGIDGVDDLGDGISYADGTLLVADNSNDTGANFKLIDWQGVAKGLDLGKRQALGQDRPVEFDFKPVSASVETAPVVNDGDAADDPTVWLHPDDPAKSLILGTNKKGGLYSYTLDGAVHQYLPVGRVNNVDIRYNVQIGGAPMTLVTATNRTEKSISIFRMDEATGKMEDVSDGVQETTMSDPYGMCMYQSAKDGSTYVLGNDADGTVHQWKLIEGAPGKVKIEEVRKFPVGSQAEGCVADDETGAFYIAEEDVALWKYGAEPETGDARTMVTSVDTNPALKDDLEGVSIYYGHDGTGYLVLSSQGNNSYAVFDRKAPHAYIGSFTVVAGDGTGIDGSSETDGLDVTAAPMGPAFPHGAFIAQDGRNIAPEEHQNFKLVPWEDIVTALGLDKPSDRSSR